MRLFQLLRILLGINEYMLSNTQVQVIVGDRTYALRQAFKKNKGIIYLVAGDQIDREGNEDYLRSG